MVTANCQGLTLSWPGWPTNAQVLTTGSMTPPFTCGNR